VVKILYLSSGTTLGTLSARVPGNPGVSITYSATSDQTLKVLPDGQVLLNRQLDREVVDSSFCRI
jgi:hypothetical protein